MKGELNQLRRQTYILGKQIVDVINEKKIISLDVLDVGELTPLAELFIIAIAPNVRQTKAIADAVEEKLEILEKELIHKEGYQSANWILLDYGDIIIHILDEEDAAFYKLLRLWQDAKKIDL